MTSKILFLVISALTIVPCLSNATDISLDGPTVNRTAPSIPDPVTYTSIEGCVVSVQELPKGFTIDITNDDQSVYQNVSFLKNLQGGDIASYCQPADLTTNKDSKLLTLFCSQQDRGNVPTRGSAEITYSELSKNTFVPTSIKVIGQAKRGFVWKNWQTTTSIQCTNLKRAVQF